MKVKVSVLMPVRNNLAYLAEAIESILGQSLGELEVLIIDDGSDDGSEKVIDRLAKKDKRIKVVRHKKPLGLVKSLNEGLELARADLVARMDGDDVSLPKRLEKQVGFMERHQDVTVLGGGYVTMDVDGRIRDRKAVETDRGYLRFLSLFHSPVAHPTVMLRRKEILELGGYDQAWSHVEDRELWLRVMEKYRVTNLDEVLVQYRIHPTSVSRRWENEQLKNKIRLSQRALEAYLKVSAEELDNLYRYEVMPGKIKPLNERYRLFVAIKNAFFRKERLNTESRKKISRFVLLQHPALLLLLQFGK